MSYFAAPGLRAAALNRTNSRKDAKPLRPREVSFILT